MKTRLESLALAIKHYGVRKGLSVFLKLIISRLFAAKTLCFKPYNDIYLRPRTSDFPTYRQVFLDGDYQFIVERKELPEIVVDLGANVGLFTVYVKGQYPEAEVISLEPDKANFKQMEINTSGLAGVTLLNKAIWSHSRGVSLESDAAKGEWGIVTVESTESAEEKTGSISMNELLEQHQISQIDILKIDIEGAEKQLFEGSIEWLDKVKMLIIELHDYIYPGSSRPFFESILKIKNFNFYVSGENLIFIKED